MDIVLETVESGCIVPSSHRLNQDGYFRKLISGKYVMYHRYVWEEEVGPIPDSFEIDHLCKNRACCNIKHLQCLSSSGHRSKDNMERSGNFSGKVKPREETLARKRARYYEVKRENLKPMSIQKM